MKKMPVPSAGPLPPVRAVRRSALFRAMRRMAVLAAVAVFPLVTRAQRQQVRLHWLWPDTSREAVGVSWGVPFARGTVKKDQSFRLVDSSGRSLPLESWPMAYWPDGSLKWSGFASVAAPGGGPLVLKAADGAPGAASGELSVEKGKRSIRISTGAMTAVIPRQGSVLVDSVSVGGKLVGCRARLECLLAQGPPRDYDLPRPREFFSRIDSVTVEQSGDVRAVVRIRGRMHSGSRSWLPFDVRLYFYSGSPSLRMVYTFIYNGRDTADFIRGLGLVMQVPMHRELYNRHVAFVGEGPGIWAEPVKPLVGRRMIGLQGRNVFPGQVAGKQLPRAENFSSGTRELIRQLPAWNDYRLMQDNADGFRIQKRTQAGSAWIDAAAGSRAGGLVFAGDTGGGVAVGIKDFWESYPGALEVRGAAGDTASIRAWLWSPYAGAMDLRHYDTTAHGLEATYEDVQKGFSTPDGIAHTSELTITAAAAVPSGARLSEITRQTAHTPLVVASPAYLHGTGALGVWSLPDTSTKGKAWIEGELNKALRFYENQVDQRNWYGFWNYGDVMHSYDAVRHTWRYDIGGFAWDNTELGSVMWLWYSFLRTGRSDVFRMAEAMTRHTSEVDVYHAGRFEGLGSRHNVRHWGDGSKEVRESQAYYHRIYYYLTTDERTGDIMKMVARQADQAMARVDPLREILPRTRYPTHARFGPDWLALAGNWMIAWQRTGDRRWLKDITTGIESFAAMPYGFFSGTLGAFGYDPATKKMYMLNDTLGDSHLAVLMGGPEVAFELTGLMDDPVWNKLWLQYCRMYGASEPEVVREFGKRGDLGRGGPDFARLAAFVYRMTGDTLYARKAWREFLDPRTRNQFDTLRLHGPDVLKPLTEIPRVSTNATAQWSLNAIELLELAGDRMPKDSPLWDGNGRQPVHGGHRTESGALSQ